MPLKYYRMSEADKQDFASQGYEVGLPFYLSADEKIALANIESQKNMLVPSGDSDCFIVCGYRMDHSEGDGENMKDYKGFFAHSLGLSDNYDHGDLLLYRDPDSDASPADLMLVVRIASLLVADKFNRRSQAVVENSAETEDDFILNFDLTNEAVLGGLDDIEHQMIDQSAFISSIIQFQLRPCDYSLIISSNEMITPSPKQHAYQMIPIDIDQNVMQGCPVVTYDSELN